MAYCTCVAEVRLTSYDIELVVEDCTCVFFELGMLSFEKPVVVDLGQIGPGPGLNLHHGPLVVITVSRCVVDVGRGPSRATKAHAPVYLDLLLFLGTPSTIEVGDVRRSFIKK